MNHHHRPAIPWCYPHAGLNPSTAPVSPVWGILEALSQQPTLCATSELGRVIADRGVLRRAKQPVPAAPSSTPVAGMASLDHPDHPPLRETVTSATKEVPDPLRQAWGRDCLAQQGLQQISAWLRKLQGVQTGSHPRAWCRCKAPQRRRATGSTSLSAPARPSPPSQTSPARRRQGPPACL